MSENHAIPEVPSITNGDIERHSFFIDQNVRYYNQTITEDEQTIIFGGLLECDAQIMAEINEVDMDNVTQIALPNQQNDEQMMMFGGLFEHDTEMIAKSNENAIDNVAQIALPNQQNYVETIMFGGLLEYHAQIMAGINEITMDNVTRIALPNQQNEIKKDAPQEFSETKKVESTKSQTMNKPLMMCNYCNFTTRQRFKLSRHLKSHSTERPFKCGVCECTRSYKCLTSLQNHISRHIGLKLHKCRSCSNAFTTSGQLMRHIQYMHSREKPHKCDVCDYTCVEVTRMKNHTKTSHSGQRERPYKCLLCPYAGTDAYLLKRHSRIHSGEKPYECDICSSRFTRSNSLKAHKLIHTGKKPTFKCDQCPVTCGRKTDLRIHAEKFHTTLDKPIECKICGDTFPDFYQYKEHCKSHRGEKCYKCELCPYTTMYNFSLESHMLIHTNEKRFHCNHCNQTYSCKSSLRCHNNMSHNCVNIPPPQN